MRNLNKIVGLMFMITLVLSLAAAQSSIQNSPSQTAPNAQSQSSPQGQPGSQAPAAPQGQSQSPSASQPQAGSNAQQGSGNGSVQDELQLTEAQKEKLRPIIQEEVTQINAVRDDQSLSMDQKRAKVEEIRQKEFPKIQAILTPEQVAKLKDMQQRAHQQQNQGNTPPSSSQPPKQQPPQ